MTFKLENSALKIEINSLGAELWSIINKKDGTEHLWQGEKDIWDERSPILFPHCGRLKDDRYVVEDETYESTLHGFARRYEHKLVEYSDTSITFLLSSNEETLKMYPFDFNLYTIYTLENNKLHFSFKVENCNNKEMPFSIGYHTGLICPFNEKKSIEDYSLIFDKEETPVQILCNDKGLLNGDERIYFNNEKEIKPISAKLTASIVLSKLKSNCIKIIENSTGRYVSVSIKDFPYVVLWSADENIKFICIEPWYGLPDLYNTDGQFDKKTGIQKLMPGESFNCTQTIEIGNNI